MFSCGLMAIKVTTEQFTLASPAFSRNCSPVQLHLRGQLLISPDCVFDASLVPGTCPGRFLDLKGLINKFLESRRNIKGRPWWSRVLSASSTAPEEERPL